MGGLAALCLPGASPLPAGDLCRLPPSHLSLSEVCRWGGDGSGCHGRSDGPCGPSPGQVVCASLSSPAGNNTTQVAGTHHGTRVCVNCESGIPPAAPWCAQARERLAKDRSLSTCCLQGDEQVRGAAEGEVCPEPPWRQQLTGSLMGAGPSVVQTPHTTVCPRPQPQVAAGLTGEQLRHRARSQPWRFLISGLGLAGLATHSLLGSLHVWVTQEPPGASNKVWVPTRWAQGAAWG